MISFVMEPSLIIASHLDPLRRYFEEAGVEHDLVWIDDLLESDGPVPGDLYISCNLYFDEWLAGRSDGIFQVQLQHNLTGIKGSPLGRSRANLTVLAGEQVMRVQGIDPDDARWVVAGYPKWDKIYTRRPMRDVDRAAISSDHGLDLDLPWVVFYPTGKNRGYDSVASRALDIRARVGKDLGPIEFVFIDHAENESRYTDWLNSAGTTVSGIHVVDGKDSLGWLRACDLFITDIASTVVTAISFGVPILFTRVRPPFGWKHLIESIQVGPFIEDVPNVQEYVEEYSPLEKHMDLFRRCVAFDDDQNCRRITALILDRYRRWISDGQMP